MVTFAAALTVGLCMVAFAWRLWRPAPAPGDVNAPASPTETNATDQRKTVFQKRKPAEAKPAEAATGDAAAPSATQPGPAAAAAAPAQPAAAAPTDPALTAMVTALRQLSGTNAVLTAESVAAWRTNLAQLVQAGPAAIPALKAFLDQKTDSAFSREAWQALGYSSARLAALDALRQIGGPEATAAMEGLLGTTSSPKEIAVLARNLEEASPGQYREQALAAVRAGLAAAVAGKDPSVDVAPLFEVFSRYGDAAVVPELEKATGQWKYYAAIALANLPDGAGLPSLLKMADPAGGSGDRIVALEMITQMATDNPTARQFLLSQVSGNAIPGKFWPYLSSPLAGDQYFPVDSAITPYPPVQSWSDIKTTSIKYGNQNLYTLPGNLTLSADGINQRVALVDELLKVTSDPAAVQTLQQARDTLARRSLRTVTQPPAGSGTAN